MSKAPSQGYRKHRSTSGSQQPLTCVAQDDGLVTVLAAGDVGSTKEAMQSDAKKNTCSPTPCTRDHSAPHRILIPEKSVEGSAFSQLACWQYLDAHVTCLGKWHRRALAPSRAWLVALLQQVEREAAAA